MIPQANLLEWKDSAPWSSLQLIEHDLILSRAICELYQHPIIGENLVFRGGTALHKLFFPQDSVLMKWREKLMGKFYNAFILKGFY